MLHTLLWGCAAGEVLAARSSLRRGGYSMPRVTETMLDSGDRFPRLTFNKVGGGTVRLPDDLAGAWGVVLLYRGHW